MSELIQVNDNRTTIRWKLLTTASAMALTAYVASTALAKAEDAARPQLWIELGGQMDIMQGLSSPFTAPFMTAVTPTPDVYKGGSFAYNQRPPRYAFGVDGTITFQPEDSDWIFSAGIRYGRSHAKRHVHNQAPFPIAHLYTYPGHAIYATYAYPLAAFRDETAPSREHHLVLDFSAGKDVGIGLLGRDGSSSISAGVRVIDLSESSSLSIYARPNINLVYPGPKYQLPQAVFNAYTMTAHAERSFKGIGPSLSWNASAALAGNKQDGELRVDWSINAALLFGRQKAKTHHSTMATYYNGANKYNAGYQGPVYTPVNVHSTRSHKVTVPNIGGSVGLSVKYPNFKFSVGYRADIFLNAMDTGIDALKKSNLSFNGPYASISIGLGD